MTEQNNENTIAALEELLTTFVFDGPESISYLRENLSSTFKQLLTQVLEAVKLLRSQQADLSLVSQAETLLFCRDILAAFKKVQKEITGYKEWQTTQTVHRMLDEDLASLSSDTHTFTSGVKVHVTTPSIGSEEAEQLKLWLFKTNNTDVIQETFSKKGVTAIAEKCFTEGTDPPEQLKCYSQTTVSIRKKGKK